MIGRARGQADGVARTPPRVGGTFHSLAHRLCACTRARSGSVRLRLSTPATPPTCSTCSLRSTACAAGARRFPRAGRCSTSTRAPSTPRLPLQRGARGVRSRGVRSTARRWPRCSPPTRARKRELGVLDLDDLLLGWRALTARGAHRQGDRRLLRPRARGRVPGRQRAAGRHRAGLARWGGGLTVVGDDFQAIYGFRAASARHILEFPEQFPDAHTVVLERNYRSTQEILAVANAVSAQDRRGFPKQPVERSRRAACARSSCSPTTRARRRGRYATGCWPRARRRSSCVAQAVLFRTGHDSALLELELDPARHPVRQVRRACAISTRPMSRTCSRCCAW